MKNPDSESNTEEKILMAARKIFLEKGFSATRTRDIAEEAGINLALLNYYFRSKQKLFELIMREKFEKFFGTLQPLFNDKTTSLEKKTELIVAHYIEVLSESPDLPIFIFNELHKKNFNVLAQINIQEIVLQSSFIQQLQERRKDINPIQFLISLLGITIFPFVAKPILTYNEVLKKNDFDILMQERKKLIPIWVDAILNSK